MPDQDGKATARDVEKQARQWSDEVLACRTYSHRWDPATAQYISTYRYYHVVRRCERCGTEQHTEMSDTGEVYSSWYDYPKGYLSSGIGRITGTARDALRVAAVTRTFAVETVRARKGDQLRPRANITRQMVGWRDSDDAISNR